MTFAKTKGYLHLSIDLSNLIFFAKLYIMPEVFYIIFKKEVNSYMHFFSKEAYFLSKLTMLKI